MGEGLSIEGLLYYGVGCYICVYICLAQSAGHARTDSVTLIQIRLL